MGAGVPNKNKVMHKVRALFFKLERFDLMLGLRRAAKTKDLFLLRAGLPRF